MSEKAKRPPRAPAGLGRTGVTMWRNVVNGYELREDELRLLESACRLTDEIGTLEEALEGAPVMVPGSRGNERVHPLFSELRNHRLALSKLLSLLGLEDADVVGSDSATRRSHNARAMAMARWGRRSG